MTERQRKLIAAYLPHPRDPELDPFDYYVKDMADRIQKVHIVNIIPGPEDETLYCVYTDKGRQIWSWHDPQFGGFHFSELYDNKEDCKDQTHLWFNGWEELRRLQKEEE